MIKAIIFDCFGVLIADSFRGIFEEISSTDPDKTAQLHKLLEKVNAGALDPIELRLAMADALGISLDSFITRLRQGDIRNDKLFDYIEELKKNYKIGLLSNVGRSGLESRFTQGELNKYFDAVVASGEIGIAKPDAQAYIITAGRLAVSPEECIMIDDREEFCLGAKEVGMQAISYQSFEQMQRELSAVLSTKGD